VGGQDWVRLRSVADNRGMTTGRGRSIAEMLAAGEHSYSFEFYPPRDEAGETQLWDAISALEPYRPTFVSVTYGAGGSTRDTTVRVTGRIAQETSLTPIAHLTCVGHTREELERILDTYSEVGVQHLMALRGDPSAGPRAPWESTPGGLDYASELVELARTRGDFRIGVAAFPEGHPSAESLDQDADVLVAKARAGAEFAVTQMFFRAEDYFALVERVRARGVDLPILPGIMPILNLNAIRRQSELIGTEVPESVVARISAHDGDPAAVRSAGIALAAELCAELLEGGAPGLHFYTLNRSKATLEIFSALNVRV
jgi:methylenetetrahydrofolate reductase (NADPH)